MTSRREGVRIERLAVAAAVCLTLAGCAAPRTTGGPVTASAPATPAAASGASSSPGPTVTVSAAPSTGPEQAAVSAAPTTPAVISADPQASSTPASGHRVWLVIPDSSVTQAEAEASLKELDAAFGKGGSGYAVQRSSDYEGMRQDLWLVARAFDSESAAQAEMERATRGRFEPFVQEVVKR